MIDESVLKGNRQPFLEGARLSRKLGLYKMTCCVCRFDRDQSGELNFVDFLGMMISGDPQVNRPERCMRLTGRYRSMLC